LGAVSWKHNDMGRAPKGSGKARERIPMPTRPECKVLTVTKSKNEKRRE